MKKRQLTDEEKIRLVNREYYRRWREAHKDHIREYHREWRKRNPDKVKAYAAKWSLKKYDEFFGKNSEK